MDSRLKLVSLVGGGQELRIRKADVATFGNGEVWLPDLLRDAGYSPDNLMPGFWKGGKFCIPIRGESE